MVKAPFTRFYLVRGFAPSSFMVQVCSCQKMSIIITPIESEMIHTLYTAMYNDVSKMYGEEESGWCEGWCLSLQVQDET